MDEVTAYIDENIVFSALYDKADEKTKKKAINQAGNTLFKYLPAVYNSVEGIPIEDIVEQAIWLLRIDDTFQRAEMGATMITVDGIQLQIGAMDRTIAPKILSLYGVSATELGGSKVARVGTYSDSMGFRTGMGRDYKKWSRRRY